jgi:thioredoxin-related protein
MVAMFRSALALIATLALASPARAVVPMGDDGLHKPDWLQNTFLDLRDDLAEANAQHKRLMIIVEQRGCIYCKKMHEEVFPTPAIDKIIRETYFVDQLNLWGDRQVTDFDGKVLAEKDMAQRWNVVFTPTMIFLPEEVSADKTAAQAAVMVMPGAFGKNTTLAMFTYIRDHVYTQKIQFQKYFADNFQMDAKN